MAIYIVPKSENGNSGWVGRGTGSTSSATFNFLCRNPLYSFTENKTIPGLALHFYSLETNQAETLTLTTVPPTWSYLVKHTYSSRSIFVFYRFFDGTELSNATWSGTITRSSTNNVSYATVAGSVGLLGADNPVNYDIRFSSGSSLFFTADVTNSTEDNLVLIAFMRMATAVGATWSDSEPETIELARHTNYPGTSLKYKIVDSGPTPVAGVQASASNSGVFGVQVLLEPVPMEKLEGTGLIVVPSSITGNSRKNAKGFSSISVSTPTIPSKPGVKGGLGKGLITTPTATISQTGRKDGKGIGVLSASAILSVSGAKSTSGFVVISPSVTFSTVGKKTTSGTGLISPSVSMLASGSKKTSGTSLIVETVTITGTSNKNALAGVIITSAGVTSSQGYKGGLGDSWIGAIEPLITATGFKTSEFEKVGSGLIGASATVSGSGSKTSQSNSIAIDAPATVSSAGKKNAFGYSAYTVPYVQFSGVGEKTSENLAYGDGIIVVPPSFMGSTGAKGAKGTSVVIGPAVNVIGTGYKSYEAPTVAGSGIIGAGAVLRAVGRKTVSGTSIIDYAFNPPYVAGVAKKHGLGLSVVTLISPVLSGDGVHDEYDYMGTGQILTGAFIVSTGVKNAHGTSLIIVPWMVTGRGFVPSRNLYVWNGSNEVAYKMSVWQGPGIGENPVNIEMRV